MEKNENKNFMGKKRVNLNSLKSYEECGEKKEKKVDIKSDLKNLRDQVNAEKEGKSKTQSKNKKTYDDSNSESSSDISVKKVKKSTEKSNNKKHKKSLTDSDSESGQEIKSKKIKKQKQEEISSDSDSSMVVKKHKVNNNNKLNDVDTKINPYTNKTYSQKYYDILKTRKLLPAWEAKQELFDLIDKNQVIILKGETGSGKTTQIPQFLLEKYKSIAVTQPRRVAAMSVARRVAEEMDVRLGDEVGYSIRFEDLYSQKTLIKYLTDGMLLKESMNDKDLNKYDLIILDECHERTLATEILFGHLKDLLTRRKDMKLIVMSATIDIKKFHKYFDEAPILDVPGRLYNVEIKYLKDACRDYLEETVEKVLEIHENEAEGDILIFMTGEEEIENTCQYIRDSVNEVEHGKIEVIPLYSTLPPQQQQKIFDPRPPNNKNGRPGRKVVVSTNIAETSITIDGVVFVIDSGYSKQKVYNPRLRMESLLVSPISKASAKQRAGRAGRTREGICYRLYTKDAFEDLEKTTYPEILRTNLSSVILTLLKLGVNDIVHFDFMDPPAPETMMRALELLFYMGAITDDGNLTEDGVVMAHTPLDPELAKVLISSKYNNCVNEILTIVSLLSIPSVFMRPRNQQTAADDAKKKFTHSSGDHLTLLTVYNTYMSNKQNDQYCRKNFLNNKNLKNAVNVRNQLEKMVINQGILPPTNDYSVEFSESKVNKILKTMLAGCFAQVANLQSAGFYYTVKEHQMVLLHPSSVLGYKPSWVLYHDFVCTGQNYIRTVTKIKAEWLFEVSEGFYNLEEYPKGPGNIKKELLKIHLLMQEKDEDDDENVKGDILMRKSLKNKKNKRKNSSDDDEESDNKEKELKEVNKQIINSAYSKYSAMNKYKVTK
jgi:pre-mRNA-splicing factor ATP-dependent RNA helicase DHX15/PRP43